MNDQHDATSEEPKRRRVSVTALHAAAGDGPTLGELKEMEASDDPAVRAEAREITKTVMAPLVA